MTLAVARGRRQPGQRVGERDWLMQRAYQAHLDSLCPGCGQPRHESMLRENTGAYQATKMRCHSCDAIAAVVEADRDSDRVTRKSALYYHADLVGRG